EEFARRAGLKGTQIRPDQHGRNIEYTLTGPAPTAERPVIICENGLGSPLESWDWVEHELRADYPVLRYHRRGYARTKSLGRPAELLESLVEEVAPSSPIVFLSHSIGALITANVLDESPAIAARTTAAYLIDGTDAELLKIARESPPSVGQYRQMTMQEILASVTGVNRWTVSKIERDVEYRPDIQRSYLVTSGSVRTLFAAQREYLHEPLSGQLGHPDQAIQMHLFAAADNVTQQQRLAERLGATFNIIEESAHRSIIGKIACARAVVRHIRETLP
ncbi:MAG: alpha/beta hydrolase, partial [Microbacteriaceae bacterium]|nr:alpha/beta hydrolase [Microbacteriaceae bacterium]